MESIPQTQQCIACGDVKPLDAFYIEKGKHRQPCKRCFVAGVSERRRERKRNPKPPKVRNPTEQACIGCGVTKPIEDFYILDPKTGRRSPRCKSCRIKQAEAYRKARPGTRSTEGKRRYLRNPNIGRDYYHSEGARANREKNREKRSAQAKQYRAQNPAKVRLQRKIDKHRRRARIKANGGSFTAAEWEALKAAQDHTCLRCGQREPSVELVPDHVVPISKGGTSSIDNIQGLCVACNNWKRARIIDYRR
jgi:5-methylcytosine-specific restriction endonuclease McrA